MRFLFIAILFVLTTRSWGQFDRVNSDPLGISPSFAGSYGQNRFGNNFSNDASGNYLSGDLINKLTYDVFVPKIKGGLGMSVTGLISNEPNTSNYGFSGLDLEMAYAPKLTFQEEITWSPSILIGYRYNRFEYFTLNPDPNQLFYFSCGLMRNSSNTFYGLDYTSGINHNVFGKTQKLKAYLGLKFDKNSQNNWSSTLYLRYEKLINLFRYYNYHDINSYSKYFSRTIKQREPFINASFYAEYTLRYRSILFMISNREVGIGLKRPQWGISVKRNYVNSLYRYNTTYFGRIDNYPFLSKSSTQIGLSVTIK